MVIFIRERLRHANDNTLLSFQIRHYGEHLWINDHQTWQNGFKGFQARHPEIPKAGFGRIRGSKPQMTGTMAIPSWTDDEAGPTTVGNVRTRGVNPSMASGACPFSEFDDFESAGDSMISLMTTEEGGIEVTFPRRFCKYFSQSFLDPTNTAL